MTNEQAVELCRRAKSVCLTATESTRATLLHWCDADFEVAATIDQLERVVRSSLDQRARKVFRTNALQVLEDNRQFDGLAELQEAINALQAVITLYEQGQPRIKMQQAAEFALMAISYPNGEEA